MQLKNDQVLGALPAMEKLLNTSMPAKQAYKVSKNMAKLKSQAEFVEERRNELVKKYGVEKDGMVSVPEDDIEARTKFFADFGEILDISEDIDIRTLTLDDIERVELTANEFESIEFMIDIPDEDEEEN